MRSSRRAAIAAAAILLPAHAFAADPPAPAAPSAPAAPQQPATTEASKTVNGVVVNGAPQPYRSSIDRKSYAIAGDLQSATGSISDALRNVPGLDVDPQGNVTLRGQAVTIMVDGKPTNQFKSDAGAQALQAVSADQYERVEVITNPSAEFKPDGAGGIINLITSKNRKPGHSASVKANLGDSGRYNGGVTAGFNSRNLSATSNVNWRRDPQKFTSVRDRTTASAAGGTTSRDVLSDQIVNEMWAASVSADYDLDDKNRLSAALQGFDFTSSGDEWDHFQGGGLSGPVTTLYDQANHFRSLFRIGQAQGTWLHKFGDDHELKINLSQEHDFNRTTWPNHITTILPVAGDTYEAFRFATTSDQTVAKADYSRTLASGVKLKAGYELDYDDNDYVRFGSSGPAPGAQSVVLARTNHFRFSQAVNAVYSSYERSFGDLTVLPGLRLEQVDTRINQVTSAIRAENDYFRAYPTLHLSYKLDDDQKLTASYSRRVRRPGEYELNPYPAYVDPFTYSVGNPYLKPEVTDSYELGYERSHNGATYQLTAYLRQTRDEIDQVVQDLGGGVLLTTRENIGKARNGGVEVVATGKFSKTLSYNLSGDAYWNQLDARDLGAVGATRSGWTAVAHGSLSWQATPKDFLQLNGSISGRQLLPQGYTSPHGLVNLGYRHKFSDRLAAVVTVRDVADTLRSRKVYDAPDLHQVERFESSYRAAFVGLTYAFGGSGKSPAKDAGFDFGGGGGPR